MTTTADLFELDLTDVDPERLRDAVFAALARQSVEGSISEVDRSAPSGRLPSAARLRSGAEETLKEDAQDVGAAEYFQSLLELGYLVASADGLADEERAALARLVEAATDSVLEQQMLRQHFRDLDGGAAVLGRRERLARVAATFEDSSAQEEAISFAALIAIADGKLAGPEATVLMELGRHFSYSEDEVRAVLSQVAASIRLALRG